MGTDEREIEEVLRIKRRRLNQLEKQVARFGYNAPPELVNERDDLRAELEKDKKALEPVIKGELSEEALAALRSYGVPASVSNALMLVETAIDSVKDALKDTQVELHDVKDKVIVLNIDMREVKRDNEEGKSGRRRNFRLLLGSLALSVVCVVFIVWLSVRMVGGV
jgi:hypothetical protein